MASPAAIFLTHRSLRSEIERSIRQFFEDEQARAHAYGNAFVELWRLAAEHVVGGKLFRPILFIEAFEALSESNEPRSNVGREQLLETATAIELLHYAFLLHDDVIDGDTRRRGTLNLIGVLQQNLEQASPLPHREEGHLDGVHWGRSGAILMGDLLLAASHQILGRLDVPSRHRNLLFDLLEHTIRESVAGEYLDVGLSDGAVPATMTTIESMTAYKTATYSFEFPLRAARILADAPKQIDDFLIPAARHLGLMFQLRDDLLSVFGDPAHHGKDPYSDLREGKQTAIVCYARTSGMWPLIEPDFGDPHLTEAQGARIQALLEQCGARTFVEDLVRDEAAALRDLFKKFSVPASIRDLLLDYSTKLRGQPS